MAEDILQAGEELGYRRADLNGRNQTGFAIAQMMVDSGLRASTARMYLRANKHRKNLVVKINSQVTKIIIDPVVKKARAVEFFDVSGKRQQVRAKREIVLSAGAVGSPHLLLLSGVGPRTDLEKFRIPVIQDLPVGKNLHNHVATGLRFFVDDNDSRMLTESTLKRFLEKRDGPLASTGLTQVTGFVKSKYAKDDVPDLQLFFDGFSARCSETGKEDECSNGTRGTPCGKRIVNLRPTNILTRSTGYLTLKSKNPLVAPAIFANYLTEKMDVDVLIEGIKFTLRLANTKAMRKWGMELDRTPAEGCEEVMFGTEDYWKCVIREHTGPENHPAGSCKMGPVGDRGAVVDPELRVHGITNLRVADASVFPLVPNGNPVASVVMVGEKAADMIRGAWSAPGAEKSHHLHGSGEATDESQLFSGNGLED